MRWLWLFGLIVQLPAWTQDERVFAQDPVALIQTGEAIAGKTEHETTYQYMTYRFVSADNKKVFLASPDTYAAQMGGTCGRMGPLSVLGRPSLYAVHDDQLYVFGSETCRTLFTEQPTRWLDPDQAMPVGDQGASAKAKALIDFAVETMGGAERLDRIKTYRHIIESEETTHGGDTVLQTDTLTLGFPDKFRRDQEFSEGVPRGYFGSGDRGRLYRNAQTWAMHADQVRAMHRQTPNHPLAVLKARSRPDFQAVALGEVTRDGRALQEVAVGYGKQVRVLEIHPGDGRILGMRYRGRGPESAFGEIHKIFRRYQTWDGVFLPMTIETLFNGEPYRLDILSALEIDPDIRSDIFASR